LLVQSIGAVPHTLKTKHKFMLVWNLLGCWGTPFSVAIVISDNCWGVLVEPFFKCGQDSVARYLVDSGFIPASSGTDPQLLVCCSPLTGEGIIYNRKHEN